MTTCSSCSSSTTPGAPTQPLFAAQGLPTSLDPDDFSPNVLQRTIRGQAGVQKFFHDQGRAFCLYVVLGSFADRQQLVPRVNQVLATMTIEPVAPGGAPSTTTTTEPPTTSTEAPTTDDAGHRGALDASRRPPPRASP